MHNSYIASLFISLPLCTQNKFSVADLEFGHGRGVERGRNLSKTWGPEAVACLT